MMLNAAKNTKCCPIVQRDSVMWSEAVVVAEIYNFFKALVV